MTSSTISLKLTDLLNNDLSFNSKDQIILTPSNKNNNSYQAVDGLDYIERCKQRHANLISQVEQTRLECKKLIYSFY